MRSRVLRESTRSLHDLLDRFDTGAVDLSSGDSTRRWISVIGRETV